MAGVTCDPRAPKVFSLRCRGLGQGRVRVGRRACPAGKTARRPEPRGGNKNGTARSCRVCWHAGRAARQAVAQLSARRWQQGRAVHNWRPQNPRPVNVKRGQRHRALPALGGKGARQPRQVHATEQPRMRKNRGLNSRDASPPAPSSHGLVDAAAVLVPAADGAKAVPAGHQQRRHAGNRLEGAVAQAAPLVVLRVGTTGAGWMAGRTECSRGPGSCRQALHKAVDGTCRWGVKGPSGADAGAPPLTIPAATTTGGLARLQSVRSSREGCSPPSSTCRPPRPGRTSALRQRIPRQTPGRLPRPLARWTAGPPAPLRWRLLGRRPPAASWRCSCGASPGRGGERGGEGGGGAASSTHMPMHAA